MELMKHFWSPRNSRIFDPFHTNIRGIGNSGNRHGKSGISCPADENKTRCREIFSAVSKRVELDRSAVEDRGDMDSGALGVFVCKR